MTTATAAAAAAAATTTAAAATTTITKIIMKQIFTYEMHGRDLSNDFVLEVSNVYG